MDWKIIGIASLVNAALTIMLSYIFFPLLFLGPIMGGLLASYPSKGFEDYDKMDLKDGAVVGAISGLIGGFIIAILFFIGLGDIGPLNGLISIFGSNIIIKGYILVELTLIISFILGLIGGVIGVNLKK